MSPRPGGEADKFGNRYEGVWTVQHVLHVLLGKADSITVEDVGEKGDGVEFSYRHDGIVEVHQLKRQNGNANYWTVRSLRDKGVWTKARQHVEAGRQYHFVSSIPAASLQDLADRARRSSDVASFISGDWLTNPLREQFSELASSDVFGSPETAWTVLQGFWIRCVDERNVIDTNAALAALALSGASGRLASVGLGDLVQHNLGVRLDASAIRLLLGQYGLSPSPSRRSPALTSRVSSITEEWADGVERELLHPTIVRSEAGELVSRLTGEDEAAQRLVLLFGDAGTGKSAVLHQAVRQLQAYGTPILCFRLDRRGPFASTADLGHRLELGQEGSPVAALEAVAEGRTAVLIVDQVDAVSLASGRMPDSFTAIAELVRESSAFPNVRVLLVCRKFDVDNDYRIAALVKDGRSAKVEVPKLAETQVHSAVRGMGLDASRLTPKQVELLRTPLHLVLLNGIATGETDALSFQTVNNLFDEFWNRKRLMCRDHRGQLVRFEQVIRVAADVMNRDRRLSASASIFDHGNLADDAAILISEHVLARDGHQIAFFHESFFGYVFAREWVQRRQTLASFLLDGEQDLFRRAQVRQILGHLRDADSERFVVDIEEVLTSPNIRRHIKEVVLGTLGFLPNPTTAEFDMAVRVLEGQPSLRDRLLQMLRTVPWFDRFDAEGATEEWLAEDSDRRDYAVWMMLNAVQQRPDRIAEVMAPHAGRTAAYPKWLLPAIRYADLHENRALFDLVLAAIRSGELRDYGRELWSAAYGLAEKQPKWAVELLIAHLVQRPDAMRLDEGGHVAALLDRDDAVIKLTTEAAAGAPEEFCALIPYMQKVMTLTEQPHGDHLLADHHFSRRHASGASHELEEALLFGAAAALRTFAGKNPDAARPLLESLATDNHDAAQWLLYRALSGPAAGHFAAWAASLLLEAPTRFLSGYVSNGVWTTREVVGAINGHLQPDLFGELEQAILGLRFSWERRRPGWYAFNLLTAMDQGRLSPGGKRRLGELQRALNLQQPPEPEGLTVGFMQSPISPDATKHMNDKQWLQAIATHANDREDFTTFKGGARELSQVLKTATTADPDRFARLALGFTHEVHPAYNDAILMGLAEADALSDPAPVFAAIRHVASLEHEDNARWLAYPLRRYLKGDIPDDLILLALDKALNAKDPQQDDRWQGRTGRDRENVGDAIFTAGINSTRGHAAEMLGDILVHDPDGRRTQLVVPSVERLARDKSLAVRSCVAHVVAACLLRARNEAVKAFYILIETDDELLAADTVQRLMAYLGNGDPAVVIPTIRRMLASPIDDTREAGGSLAALAGLEWGHEPLLRSVLEGTDAPARKGAAGVCAHRMPVTSNTVLASSALQRFANDGNKDVRAAAAEVAGALRGERLRPYRQMLMNLLASQAFEEALSQLLITLERAPDRVDELVTLCARRFIDVMGQSASDISTGAAAEAHEVAQLVLKGYVHASTPAVRSEALDLIDQLLALNAYGVSRVVDDAER